MSKKIRKRNSKQVQNNSYNKQPITSKQNRSLQMEYIESSSFSGPMPPPKQLGEYENILPGSAKTILDMAVSEQTQRHSLESKELEGIFSLTKRGQYLGFSLAGLGIIVTAILIYFDKDITQFGVILGILATLIGIAIYGRGRKVKSKKDFTPSNESD